MLYARNSLMTAQMRNQELKNELQLKVEILRDQLLSAPGPHYDQSIALILSELLRGRVVKTVIEDQPHWFIRVTIPVWKQEPTAEGEDGLWVIDTDQPANEYDCDIANGGMLGPAGSLYETTELLEAREILLIHVREAVRHAERARLLRYIPQLRELKRQGVKAVKRRERGVVVEDLSTYERDRLGNIVSKKRQQQRFVDSVPKDQRPA